MTEITPRPTDTIPNTVGRKTWKMVREIALLTFTLLLAIGITRSMVGNIAVNGVSMDPTLHASERVLVNKSGYWIRSPRRGDIVIAYDQKDQVSVIKRIIGLPGEELVFKQGMAFINGQLLHEPYVPPAHFVPAARYPVPSAADIAQGDGRWLIPDGHYFILGDNRNFSEDSRAFGAIAAADLQGKVQLLVWPPARWGVVTHHRDYGIAAD